MAKRPRQKCGLCGKAGHNRLSCSHRPPSTTLTAHRRGGVTLTITQEGLVGLLRSVPTAQLIAEVSRRAKG
jgi:hypothetical protein